MAEDEEDLDSEHHDIVDESGAKRRVFISTHERIDAVLCGDLEKLEEGFAKVCLRTTEGMRADDDGLCHAGFIFSAADYAAMLAVNKKNVIITSARSIFLCPVRVGDEVCFEARVRHREGRRRDVHVSGFLQEVKVFEAEMRTVITDKHILKLNLKENIRTFQKRQEDQMYDGINEDLGSGE